VQRSSRLPPRPWRPGSEGDGALSEVGSVRLGTPTGKRAGGGHGHHAAALATRLEELPLDAAAEVPVLLEPALAALEQQAARALERAPADHG
jgi:hypothetical protein